jgi:hypothetical protein
MSAVLVLLARPENIRLGWKFLTVANATSLPHYDNYIQHSIGFKQGFQREELRNFYHNEVS